MKVLIIEDEPLSSEKIVNYLSRYDQSIEVVARLDSVESSIQWFRNNEHPDLVFLDIYLSDEICFSIFDEVDVRAPVIFTTAHDSYALKAFELNSVDYLLKPIKYEAISNALDKYRHITGDIYLKDFRARMKGLLESMDPGKKQYKSRFLVKKGNKIQYIDTYQIAYFYAESKLTFLITEWNDEFILDNSLDILQNQLDPKHFFRVNRKFLIHIKSLKAIHPFFKGRLKIGLDPPFSDEIIISREKAQLFKGWLDQ